MLTGGQPICVMCFIGPVCACVEMAGSWGQGDFMWSWTGADRRGHRGSAFGATLFMSLL